MSQSGGEQSNTNEKPSVAAATGGKQDTSAATLATGEKENTNAEANVTVHVEKKDPITASTVPTAENKNTNAAAVVAAPAASAEIQNATDVCDEKFPTWDNDAEMMKQIKDTHGRTNREIDMKPLLQIIKDVLDPVASNTPGNFREIEAQLDAVKDKALQATLKDISDSIRGISCEISCKCPGSGRGGAHATSMALFITLSKYSWDAKAVIALAAFAANYAKFWPTAQQIVTDPQHATSFIDHLPRNFADIVKPNLEALRNLIKVTVEVTKGIIEFKDKNIAADCPGLSDATHHFPAAVYWTVRSIVACASQLMALVGMGHEYIQWTMEAVELLSLAHMVSNIHSHLMKKLNKCHQHMACATLKEQITGAHGNNLETLKALIYNKNNQHLIIDGSTKEQVDIKKLKQKNVLLFISDLDISCKDLSALIHLYKKSAISDFISILWLPVVDTSLKPLSEVQRNLFEGLQRLMPWYTVCEPSMLVIRFVKEEWKFNKSPLMVLVDNKGMVRDPKDLHMIIWSWEGMEFPFNKHKDEDVWETVSWNMGLLAGSVSTKVSTWISVEKHICLYGGDDIEWIKKFTTAAKDIARNTGKIELEMLYVGTSEPGWKVEKNIATIVEDKLGDTLPDLAEIQFFWRRLESLKYSRKKFGKSEDNDPILRGLTTVVFKFDNCGQGWAVISKGKMSEMAEGNGDAMFTSLKRYEGGKNRDTGFVPGLKKNLQELDEICPICHQSWPHGQTRPAI